MFVALRFDIVLIDLKVSMSVGERKRNIKGFWGKEYIHLDYKAHHSAIYWGYDV